jgi:hypothetical protein
MSSNIDIERTWVQEIGRWVGLGVRFIRVIRFYLFGFLKFRVMKNENRNFQNNFRN